MRHFGTGIAVVTTCGRWGTQGGCGPGGVCGPEGACGPGGACGQEGACSACDACGGAAGPRGACAPHGMTANSLLSISLRPPTLLISPQRGSRTQALIRETGAFTVNILAADQHALADHFTRRDAFGADEFAGIDHRPSRYGGGPELAGSAAVLSCRTTRHVEVADHTLIIAEVTAVGCGGPGEPLLYPARSYRRLGEGAGGGTASPDADGRQLDQVPNGCRREVRP
ncbi:flavin reductase family protein [Streptomyces sp. B22F1]|uniref:flavin reductase family protein n=1 Tax=Streptomyces sp. B22F1 TaxID=3153566 RepID=UPI00325E6FCE